MNNLFIATLSTLFLASMILAKDLDLSNDQEFLIDRYLNRQLGGVMKLYVFNFTNPEEFFSNPNSKAKLDPVGPYVYSANWIREEVKWIDDGQVEFIPKRIFRYVPRLSGNRRQTDRISALNVPLMVALSQMKDGPAVARNAVEYLVEALDQKLYGTSLIRELFWGEFNPLIKLVRDVQKDPKKKYPYEKYGLMVGLNFTNRGKATVGTGLDGKGYLGELLKWNDKEFLNLWQPGSDCDRPRGSLGQMIKPNTNKKDNIHLFNRNFCRSYPLEFKKEVTSQHGINAWRFGQTSESLKNMKESPENQCFCVGGSCKKLPAGLFNMTECQFDAPIIFSPPHFTKCDKSLLDGIEGLQPDEDKYLTYMDINPQLASTMKYRITGQISIEMREIKGIKQAEGLRNMIFPLMYFINESDDDDFDEDDIKRFKSIIAKRS